MLRLTRRSRLAAVLALACTSAVLWATPAVAVKASPQVSASCELAPGTSVIAWSGFRAVEVQYGWLLRDYNSESGFELVTAASVTKPHGRQLTVSTPVVPESVRDYDLWLVAVALDQKGNRYSPNEESLPTLCE
jgi:hypothetical protein